MLTDRKLHRVNIDAHTDTTVEPTPAALPATAAFAALPPTDAPSFDDGGGGNEACGLIMANLAAYQDNELNAEERRVVEAHLAECVHCSSSLAALQTNDRLIEREWRESAPLPSSKEFRQSVDAIMAALPPVPAKEAAFAPKRVHSRARWMRFSSGFAGIIALFCLIWSSYQLGYAHGRLSHRPGTTPVNFNIYTRGSQQGTMPAPYSAPADPDKPSLETSTQVPPDPLIRTSSTQPPR